MNNLIERVKKILEKTSSVEEKIKANLELLILIRETFDEKSFTQLNIACKYFHFVKILKKESLLQKVITYKKREENFESLSFLSEKILQYEGIVNAYALYNDFSEILKIDRTSSVEEKIREKIINFFEKFKDLKIDYKLFFSIIFEKKECISFCKIFISEDSPAFSIIKENGSHSFFDILNREFTNKIVDILDNSNDQSELCAIMFLVSKLFSKINSFYKEEFLRIIFHNPSYEHLFVDFSIELAASAIETNNIELFQKIEEFNLIKEKKIAILLEYLFKQRGGILKIENHFQKSEEETVVDYAIKFARPAIALKLLSSGFASKIDMLEYSKERIDSNDQSFVSILSSYNFIEIENIFFYAVKTKKFNLADIIYKKNLELQLDLDLFKELILMSDDEIYSYIANNFDPEYLQLIEGDLTLEERDIFNRKIIPSKKSKITPATPTSKKITFSKEVCEKYYELQSPSTKILNESELDENDLYPLGASEDAFGLLFGTHSEQEEFNPNIGALLAICGTLASFVILSNIFLE